MHLIFVKLISTPMKSELEIKEYEPSQISKPNVLLAVPEAGLVGTIACSYLRDQLNLPELGYIESELLTPVVVVHESKPKHAIRIFGKDDLVVVMSEVPLHPRLSLELASEVAKWAKSKNSKLLIGITSLPYEGEGEREEDRKPNVFVLPSEDTVVATMKQIGAVPFEEGMLMGTYAALLKHSIRLQQPNLTLMAEAYRQFPDPGAAAAVLQVANKILKVNVDVGNLIKESEEVRLRMRELMARTQENMRRTVTTAPSYYT
jgi:uncharacterized protein